MESHSEPGSSHILHQTLRPEILYDLQHSSLGMMAVSRGEIRAIPRGPVRRVTSPETDEKPGIVWAVSGLFLLFCVRSGREGALQTRVGHVWYTTKVFYPRFLETKYVKPEHSQ